MSLATLVEEAVSHGSYDSDGLLVVLDALMHPNGTQVRVGWDGRMFRAEVRDNDGRSYSCTCASRLEAVERALDGYLDMLNNPA